MISGKLFRGFTSLYLAYISGVIYPDVPMELQIGVALLVWIGIYLYENPAPDRALDAQLIGQAIQKEIENKIRDKSN